MKTILRLNAYQQAAAETANYKASLSLESALAMAGLGIAGEAGEVADIVKKHLYHGKPLDRDHLVEELGDVLWYIAAAADALGVSLSDIATFNIDKLAKRYAAKLDAQVTAACPCGQDALAHEVPERPRGTIYE